MAESYDRGSLMSNSRKKIIWKNREIMAWMENEWNRREDGIKVNINQRELNVSFIDSSDTWRYTPEREKVHFNSPTLNSLTINCPLSIIQVHLHYQGQMGYIEVNIAFYAEVDWTSLQDEPKESSNALLEYVNNRAHPLGRAALEWETPSSVIFAFV